MSTISVVIITKNEERNIKECLESIKWADEIIIVDSFSTDRTIEICREYTDKIYQIEWKGYAFTKNFGISKANGEWILSLDADEVVTPELAFEIKEAIRKREFDGYYIPRKNIFLKKWIRYCGWYPNYQLKLFRKGEGRFASKEVHEYVILDGRVGYLSHPIIHNSYASISQYFEKFNRYTSLEVKDMITRGEKFRLYKLIFLPLFRFFYMFIYKKGFMDGLHGFLICLFSSFYEFVKYAKLWEAEKTKELRTGEY